VTDADLADIRRTIRHWRNRGVIREVASELHCSPNWPAIERRMIKWQLGPELAELSRKAA
jgi:hypothetical protein